MVEFENILSKVRLFNKISHGEIRTMLSCLGGVISEYKKGDFILMAGDSPKYIGVVLRGTIHVIEEDAEGERIVVNAFGQGDFFAEALCCAGVKESPVSVTAASECAVMLMEFRKILSICPNTCLFHTQLIENMLYVLAQKNLDMQTRLRHIGKRTMRKKILSYLEHCAKIQGSKSFTIPLNREQMADFLFVERTALSHELAAMKKEQLIDYYKNSFKLL